LEFLTPGITEVNLQLLQVIELTGFRFSRSATFKTIQQIFLPAVLQAQCTLTSG